MTVQGTVFNIMRYSTKDGPGLRTTVFLKGCPLNCLWCHNPESIRKSPELVFHQSFCITCGGCVEACPHDAIEMGASGPLYPREACDRCQRCAEQCPADAREFIGKTMSVSAVMHEILKDRIFYDDSGGGVTVSGGEPLAQPEFLRCLAAACSAEEINVTVDTTLHAPWADIEAILPHTDLFLVDLKYFSGSEHKDLTGVSNNRIIENIRRIDRNGAKIIVRMPLVKDVTTDSADIRNRILFLSSLQNLAGIELLPYHAMSSGKLTSMNRENEIQHFAAPGPTEISTIEKLIEAHNITVIRQEQA